MPVAHKHRARTPAERAADTFDADLYRLVTEAERNAHNLKRSTDGEQWKKIAAVLRFTARPLVRVMMHDDDRAETT